MTREFGIIILYELQAQDDKVAGLVAGELGDSVAFSSDLDAFLNETVHLAGA
jgi:hypothetical protein